ncbi:RNA polymerase sigma factor [Paractinoplanes durhamensis]|uniref:DNA-directed RNA polymerase sigma-70 factor n=1 Tax=Paractinoplanes durhamensis TaxID=113563 RepID=A0ABQ3YZT3_9ACTN|nr:sigma-70 family RNA polymerase sigma factor [Actinoplanes durhamensis]GIE03083.1 DNA-directed RNA polymerase sigma-70 factor [Actinoplanes durhamensis]
MKTDQRRARFEALAPAVIEAVRRYLARRTDPATADDVLSETLLICWRRLDEMPAEHLPWAYGVARNCLANAERSHRRQARLFARISVLDPPPATTDGPEPPDEELATAIGRLRDEDAELLRLWAWEELAPAEIAVTLGITANAASIRLHRAKQRLRDELRKTGGTAGHEESTEGRRP